MKLVSICTFMTAVVLSTCTNYPFDWDLHERVLDTELCDRQLKFLANSADSVFHEANKNFPHHVEFGDDTIFYAGDFSKCLSIQEEHGVLYQGKYCLVLVDPPVQPTTPSFSNKLTEYMEYKKRSKWFMFSSRSHCKITNVTRRTSFTFGVCIPSACSIDRALTPLLNLDKMPLTIGREEITQSSFRKDHCRLPNDKPMMPVDYVAMIIFGIFFLLATVSTIYDIICPRKRHGKKDCIYRSFSAYSNVRRLLDVSSPPGSLQCIDGIRVFSMALVVLMHAMHFYNKPLIPHLIIYLSSAHLVVDTFLVVSGLLLVYTALPKYKTVTNFLRNLHMFYLNRLLRIYPALCTVVLLQASLVNHISDGPTWIDVINNVNWTQQAWWTILGFVNNFISICAAPEYYNNIDNFGHLWYLAVDMQYFVMSPLVLVWLFGRRSTAWTVLAVCLLTLQACSTVLTFLLNVQAFETLSAFKHSIYYNELYDNFSSYYTNALFRLPPYLIGMLTGYLIHVCDRKELTTAGSKWAWRISSLCLLTLSLSTLVLIVYSEKVYYQEHDQEVENFLLAFNRSIWAVCISCVIFLCNRGYGGVINRFLSSQIWRIFSSLSYTVYVLHYTVIQIIINYGQLGVQILNNNAFLEFYTIVCVVSITGAVLIYIIIEMPIVNIYRIININVGNKA